MSKHEKALSELRDMLDGITFRAHHMILAELKELPKLQQARMLELFDVVAERSSDDTITQFVFDYPEQLEVLLDE